MGFGYFYFPKLEGQISNRMSFKGKDCLVWSLNNYLGLANHPEVRKADQEAAEKWGLGYPMGARMMSGQTEYHQHLEKQLAEFEGKESAYLLNFGYQGMVSIIDSLVDRHDVVVYDSEAHACILDGLRLIIDNHQVPYMVTQDKVKGLKNKSVLVYGNNTSPHDLCNFKTDQLQPGFHNAADYIPFGKNP